MRSEKTHLANYIGSRISGSNFVYFISYKGLTVKDFSSLRKKLAECNAECKVLKNTMIKKASELVNCEAIAQMDLKDSTAMVTGSGDASAVAKVLIEFSKTCDKVVAKSGFFEGAILSTEEIKGIASLPSKEVLQAMLLGVLQAPSRNLVTLLNAKVATIVNVINAYKDTKQE